MHDATFLRPHTCIDSLHPMKALLLCLTAAASGAPRPIRACRVPEGNDTIEQLKKLQNPRPAPAPSRLGVPRHGGWRHAPVHRGPDRHRPHEQGPQHGSRAADTTRCSNSCRPASGRTDAARQQPGAGGATPSSRAGRRLRPRRRCPSPGIGAGRASGVIWRGIHDMPETIMSRSPLIEAGTSQTGNLLQFLAWLSERPAATPTPWKPGKPVAPAVRLGRRDVQRPGRHRPRSRQRRIHHRADRQRPGAARRL